MSLHEELRRSGRWLFRWRSYVPLLPLAIALVALRSMAPAPPLLEHVWELGCLAISLTGLGIRIHAIGHSAPGTSEGNTGRPGAASLNTTGLYSVVRHPLYVGNFLMWTGVALFPRVWWLVVIAVLAFWICYERIMYAEEEFLRERFGEEFAEWASRTPAFIPRLRNWIPPDRPFSLRRVLRREYSPFLGVFATFTVLDMTAYLFQARNTTLDMWLVLFAFALVAYLTLVAMKKMRRAVPSTEG